MAARPPRRTGQAGERQARAGAGRGRRVVYDRIKTDILTLVLQPGQDIDEVSLSRRYGVSRTPIREALILLSSDGLVSFGQNRRASVTPLIIADYPRYIEALDLTRRAVSRLAAARRHDIELPKLREAEAAFARAARGSNVASEALANRLLPVEMALQLRVAETGHNGYLTQSYDRLLTLGQRMLRIPYAYDPHPGEPVDVFVRRVVKRHGDLVGAIEAGDADGAEAEAHALVVDLVKRLRSYFEENLTLGLAMGVEPQRGAASGVMEDVVVGKRPTGGSSNGD